MLLETFIDRRGVESGGRIQILKMRAYDSSQSFAEENEKEVEGDDGLWSRLYEQDELPARRKYIALSGSL